MIDSGSSNSNMSTSLYSTLCEMEFHFKEILCSIQLASGRQRTYTVLSTLVPITLQGYTFEIEMMYCPENPVNQSLLGIDFIRIADIDANPTTNTWCFRSIPNKQYPMNPTIQIAALDKVNDPKSISLTADECPTLTNDDKDQLNNLLLSYNDIFNDFGPPTTLSEHSITLKDGTEPIALSPYRINSRYRSEVKRQLDEMLANGIIEECESAWAAPLVIVPKKTKDLRLCVDYRKLNHATIADKYALPVMSDLLSSMKPTKFITLLDLKSGYWQVPMNKADADKTAFTCEFGLFRFNRMPFGLKNAPATFQRMVNKLRNLLPSVPIYTYLDDIMVISASFSEHTDHLKKLLETLRKYNLRINRQKCQFLCERVKYLGHVISTNGISVDQDKISAILNIQEPGNPKEVQVFLQTCSWYRKFIPKFAEISRPLSQLTKQNVAWTWSTLQQQSFDLLKENSQLPQYFDTQMRQNPISYTLMLALTLSELSYSKERIMRSDQLNTPADYYRMPNGTIQLLIVKL